MMQRRRYLRTAIALLSFLRITGAFSLPRQRALMVQGGGASRAEEEDQELDDYIERLIAGVEDSDEATLSVRASSVDSNVEDVVHEIGTQREPENHELDTVEDDNDEIVDNDVDDSPVDSIQDSTPDNPVDESTIEIEDMHDASELTTSVFTASADSNDDTEEPPVSSRKLPVASPRPPNAVYRFLLGQGQVGHVILMFLVWIAEFVKAFVPPIADFLHWILTLVLGAEKAQGVMNGAPLPTKSMNEQYAAFADSRSLRGRQKKRISKKADQEAAEQLRRVGSVDEARYHHLSVDFMRRHQIGPFKVEAYTEKKDEISVIHRTRRHGDDDDEDVDWVVKALTSDGASELEEVQEQSSKIKPSVSIGVSNSGVSVDVGISIGSSGGKKRRSQSTSRRRKSLIHAATAEASTRSKRIGPRVSDRDGGGGMLGRIRDFSANNVVSRSLLGAYPGDAVPPTEAASANGVFSLATKYGYGEWSEEADEDEELSTRRKKKKRRVRSFPRAGSRSKMIRLPTERLKEHQEDGDEGI